MEERRDDPRDDGDYGMNGSASSEGDVAVEAVKEDAECRQQRAKSGAQGMSMFVDVCPRGMALARHELWSL